MGGRARVRPNIHPHHRTPPPIRACDRGLPRAPESFAGECEGCRRRRPHRAGGVAQSSSDHSSIGSGTSGESVSLIRRMAGSVAWPHLPSLRCSSPSEGLERFVPRGWSRALRPLSTSDPGAGAYRSGSAGTEIFSTVRSTSCASLCGSTASSAWAMIPTTRSSSITGTRRACPAYPRHDRFLVVVRADGVQVVHRHLVPDTALAGTVAFRNVTDGDVPVR